MSNDAAHPERSRSVRSPSSEEDPTLVWGQRLDDEDLPVPEFIGPYPILQVLGRGGMGVVYAARDERLGRPIAIKVMPERMARNESMLAQFEQEARLLAAMNHPNIATIFSLEETPEFHFITMEFVQGRTLSEHLTVAALPLEFALTVCRQIARALEAAHEARIVHRDIKPDNIMLTTDRQVKVLDFGLARAWGDDASLEVSGTPGYMSPEQCRGELAHRSADTWALACVLYECLTGRKLVSGGSATDRLRRTQELEFDRRTLSGEVPAAIASLLDRCLRLDPEDRLRDVAPVRKALDEELMHQRAVAHAPRAPRPRPGTPTNLPASVSTFVGRRTEIWEVETACRMHRLVTVAGAGGCGKTRLVLEVAGRLFDRFADGVWFVDLSALPSDGNVSAAVMRILGVQPERGRALHETLENALADRRTLLILDNCEHLVRTCRKTVRNVLHAAPGVTVLTTSREPIGESGEVIYRITPLPVPPVDVASSLRELSTFDGVRLFLDRARESRATFQLTSKNRRAVLRICHRLDGIPLGLELAAARVGALSVEEIAERLDRGFGVLKGAGSGSGGRHDTLRALIEWSHDLLSPSERAVFRRLAVFSGGWTLEAAEAVCVGERVSRWEVVDAHARLVDKSLVVMVGEPEPTRYRMLEAVRDYAVQRLDEADEREDASIRHLDHVVSLAERAEPKLRSFEQTTWLRRIGCEHDNLRVAFTTCLDPSVAPSHGLRLAGALGRYWMIQGHWREGRDWCARVLDRARGEPPSVPRANTLNAAGNLAFHKGEYAEAQRSHRAALAMRRWVGDVAGQSNSLNNLGEVARMRGEPRRARVLYQAALALQERIDDAWGAAVSHNNLGEVAQNHGDYARARTHHDAALRLWPKIGDRWGVAWSLSNLGFVALREGKLTEARAFYERSLSTSRDIGDEAGVALSLHALGTVAEGRGDWTSAASLHRDSLTLRQKLGDRKGIAESLEAFAAIASATGRPATAAQLLGAAVGVRDCIHAPRPAAGRGVPEAEAGTLRARIGEERFTAQYEQGRLMFLDDAVHGALTFRVE